MPVAWQFFFERHIYSAILMAATLEGLGVPLPAELLFLAAGLLIHRGAATLEGVIAAGVAGNVLGSMVGYGLAYVGGAGLLHRVATMVNVKPAAFRRVETFFQRYGAATVFLSRFVGFIRAAAIYSAGLARMQPWRFAAYLVSSALIWNAAWAWMAFQFGSHLPRLVHRTLTHLALVLVVCLGASLLGGLAFRWWRGDRNRA